MDIFDLSIEEFEKKVDELLDNISEEELLEELIQGGLIIDEYEDEGYYIEENYDNIWIHKAKKNNMEKILSLLNRREKEDLLEAA